MRPSIVDNSNASKAILQDLSDVEFLLCIGDGKNDESLFTSLNKDWEYTVTVGKKRTEAGYYVENVKEVQDFLNRVVESSM